MTKKERVIAAIHKKEVDHVPCGFSLHFPMDRAFHEEGVKAHLEFFEATDTDMVKIMNENLVPCVGDINCAEDWNKIPEYSLEDPFMKDQLHLTQEILDQCDRNSFVIATIHGLCASALHPIRDQYGYDRGREIEVEHYRENKEPVLAAFQRITDGMCLLVKKLAQMGVDGIYYAALGAEQRYFTDEEFKECIEPFDKQILRAAKDAGIYTILHMCKDGLDMKRYASYADLADIVNWGVYETDFSIEEGRKLFPNATIMGGLANRSGVLVDGTEEELTAKVKEIISEFGGKGFILGADCTLPTEIPYERIRLVADTAK